MHREQLFADVVVPPLGDASNDRSQVKIVLLLDAREERRISADAPRIRVFYPIGQVGL